MTVVNGDVLRITVNFSLPDGTQYQNVYHMIAQFIASFGDSTVVDEVKAWVEAVYATVITMVNSGTTEQVSSVDKVAWTGTEWEVTANVGTFVPSFAPTGAGDVCPNQISPFVVFKTERPRSVGRKFMFPVMETDQNQGILSPGAIALLVAYAAEVMTDITMAPLSTLIPGIPRTAVNAFLTFFIGVVTDIVGTQRRRRPGVGA